MNIKILVKLRKSGSEIREMLMQVYKDNALKKTAVSKWLAGLLREEKVSLTKRSGRPARRRTEEIIAEVRQIICENHPT
jgi:hypothetical protein